jgi:hypothetical protein
MPSEAYAEKQSHKRSKDKWDHAVQVTRAWKVAPYSQFDISDFANETYKPGSDGNGQAIGSMGMPLTSAEAAKLLTMDIEEVSIFGHDAIGSSVQESATRAFKPSKPGPARSSPTMMKEAEGPRHLYILEMGGKPGIFLNDHRASGSIIKVGCSGAPNDRLKAHNAHYPNGPFRWNIQRSTEIEGRLPFPNHDVGVKGEQAMITYLDDVSKSLGGEFFLTEAHHINEAWKIGIEAAENAT